MTIIIKLLVYAVVFSLLYALINHPADTSALGLTQDGSDHCAYPGSNSGAIRFGRNTHLREGA
jgi:hypothetical protein